MKVVAPKWTAIFHGKMYATIGEYNFTIKEYDDSIFEWSFRTNNRFINNGWSDSVEEAKQECYKAWSKLIAMLYLEEE